MNAGALGAGDAADVDAVAAYLCGLINATSDADLQVARKPLVELVGQGESAVTAFAAVGIVRRLWRNTELEDVHGDGRIHDGEMFSANVATTRLAFDQLRASSFDLTVVGRSIAAPERIVAGRSVRDVFGPRFRAWSRWVARQADDLDQPGLTQRQSLLVLAFMARVSPPWWGLPSWPGRVDRFLDSLVDSPPIPKGDLRRLLIDAPDELPIGVLDWCVDHLISYA